MHMPFPESKCGLPLGHAKVKEVELGVGGSGVGPRLLALVRWPCYFKLLELKISSILKQGGAFRTARAHVYFTTAHADTRHARTVLVL